MLKGMNTQPETCVSKTHEYSIDGVNRNILGSYKILKTWTVIKKSWNRNISSNIEMHKNMHTNSQMERSMDLFHVCGLEKRKNYIYNPGFPLNFEGLFSIAM